MPHRFSIWDEWKSWTRFQALIDYSLETSATLWQGLPVKDRDQVTIQRTLGQSRFACPGNQFLPMLQDRHTISSLLVLSSYALIEGHIEEVLDYMVTAGVVGIQIVDDVRAGTQTAKTFIASGGIETWGTSLLLQLGRDWGNVHDGCGGIVEVAIVRNALAHGARTVTQSMINRVQQNGGALPWAIGAPIRLDLSLVRTYRDRLRSFARVIGFSAVHHAP
jgi:hypothetical protein